MSEPSLLKCNVCGTQWPSTLRRNCPHCEGVGRVMEILKLHYAQQKSLHSEARTAMDTITKLQDECRFTFKP